MAKARTKEASPGKMLPRTVTLDEETWRTLSELIPATRGPGGGASDSIRFLAWEWRLAHPETTRS